MTQSRSLRTLLLGALTGLFLAGLLPATQSAAQSAVGSSSAVAVAAARNGAIDTSSREAVSEAWSSRMAENLDVASQWTGNAAECRTGKPSSQAQDATLESLNFVRAMAGLDEVALDSDLSKKAQEAALIMTANSALSHEPPKAWNCWTKTGADAAGRSDLALTSGVMTAGRSVQLYLDDAGPSNQAAGHRRWLLNPFSTAVGNGLTTSANAMYVVGPTDAEATNPNWVSWPTEGWFPNQLEPQGRWSLSSGSAKADFSHATVTVSRGTTALSVKQYTPRAGFAQPTLVFQVKGLQETGNYRVVVRHIRGADASKRVYTVRLFTP